MNKLNHFITFYFHSTPHAIRISFSHNAEHVMSDFQKQLLERFNHYVRAAKEADEEVERAKQKSLKFKQAAAAAKQMLEAEGVAIPCDRAVVTVPTAEVTIVGAAPSVKASTTTMTGLRGLGFREAVMKILDAYPNGAKASDIAESIKNSDFDMPDLATDLGTRVANDCSRLIKQGRVIRPERGVFLLPKYKKDPTADTEGSLFNSTNGD